MMTYKISIFALITGLMIVAAPPLMAQSGDPLKTQRHFKIKNPARLTIAEALSAYENVSGQLFRGYAASKDPTAMVYGTWRRYSTAPYTSATHGNRYVSNYGNRKASSYGSGKFMPAGAIIAKDSFTVTKDRAVYAGALFIMEKLAEGTSPQTGDWRYQMIMPDGSLFGDSLATGAKEVAFCHTCHTSEKKNDYLFYIPKKYRRVSLD